MDSSSGCPSKPQNNLTRPLTLSLATIFILTLIYFVFKSIFDCIMKHNTTTSANQTSATTSSDNVTAATEPISEPGIPCCQQQRQHFDMDIIIPVVTYDVQPSSLPYADDDERCSICLGEFCYGNTVRVLPKCQHMFHKNCIDDWLPFRSSFCPVCRARAIEVHDEPPRTTCTNDGTASPPLILNFVPNNAPSFL